MSLPQSGNLRAIGICAAIAVGASLGVLAPPAMAAPANDNFANRATLPGTLSVSAEGSNVGATAEGGEAISGGGFDAHHSVWWQWQSPVDINVTVGTCGTTFRSVVGIFEGEEWSTLLQHRVVPEGEVEGPECGSRYIFHAVAGTKYEFGIDGNDSWIPLENGAPTGLTGVEGTVKLVLSPTPPPFNNAFAEATPITTNPAILPDGREWTGSAVGYNWGATAEPGEPAAAGLGAGASVWYRWTAPETGNADVAVGGDQAAVLGVYTGSGLGALTPVASSAEPFFRPASFEAEAGQEYRIAVDGKARSGGEPWMGRFALSIREFMPNPPKYEPNAPLPRVPGTTPAATAKASKHLKKQHRKAKKRRHHRRHRARHRAARHHAAG